MKQKIKTCIICGNDFFATSNNQKTCSCSCQLIDRRLKQKLYKREHALNTQKNEKHCSKCSQKFVPVQNSQTVCPECKQHAPRTIICIECGNEFTTTSLRVKLLCSDECKKTRKNKMRAKYGFKRKPNKPIIKQCQYCGNDFEAKNGSKYCSHTCKKRIKNEQSRKCKAEMKRRQAAEKKPVICTCIACNNQFESLRKMRYCSDDCRLAVKREKAKFYNRTRSTNRPAKRRPVKIKKATPIVQKLNKNNPRPEKVLVENMVELNRNAPVHDRDILKEKKIKSPNLSKMPFRIHDPALRQTFFFTTEEKYNNYLKRKQDEQLKCN